MDTSDNCSSSFKLLKSTARNSEDLDSLSYDCVDFSIISTLNMDDL